MLSDARIRTTKPGSKPIRLRDERGLYLEVSPSGGRWWRLKYRFAGKYKLLSMGTYPDTTLKAARDKRDRARELLSDGVDPSETRRTEKASRSAPVLNGFESVAREWPNLAASTAAGSRPTWRVLSNVKQAARPGDEGCQPLHHSKGGFVAPRWTRGHTSRLSRSSASPTTRSAPERHPSHIPGRRACQVGQDRVKLNSPCSMAPASSKSGRWPPELAQLRLSMGQPEISHPGTARAGSPH